MARTFPSGEVPPPLLFFTALVCVSVMANFTLLVPVSTYYTTTLLASGVILASYAGGALVSLFFWSTYDRRAVRPAYMAQAALMCGGNLAFGVVAASDADASTSFYGLLAARFVVGLEAGCMYNANLALIGYSAPELRVKYLAMYQSFVGGGLVLGPAVASTCTAVASAMGSPTLEESLSAFVMAGWGLTVLVLVATYLPSDAELESRYGRLATSGLDDDVGDAEAARAVAPRAGAWVPTLRQELLLECFLGNFLRIYQRLAWEVGAVVVLALHYDWGYVAAGYALSFYGLAQAVTQYGFGEFGRDVPPARVLDRLEFVEACAIGAMFTLADAEGDAKRALCAVFVLASLVFYLANCLTSAPYNALVLAKARAVDKEEMLLASQYGIFFALLGAPVVIRGATAALGAVDNAQNTLAAVLLAGWAAQTVVNGYLTGGIASLLAAATGATLAALVFWAMLDKSVGGTGWANVFSWHPILMALAFFAAMTSGALAYREDFGPPAPKETRRRRHAFGMASAFALAVGGYAAIFAAHWGGNQLGGDTTWSRTVHVWMGYPCLAWLVLQAGAGAVKARTMEATGERLFTWHGASGGYLILAGYATATVGFWLHMNDDAKGWNYQLKIALTALAAACAGFRLLPNGGAAAAPVGTADETSALLARKPQIAGLRVYSDDDLAAQASSLDAEIARRKRGADSGTTAADLP